MVGFVVGWRDSSEVVEDSPVVEPVDPFEGGELEVFETAPGAFVPDECGLVEAVDGFGERVDAPIGQERVSGRVEAGRPITLS